MVTKRFLVVLIALIFTLSGTWVVLATTPAHAGGWPSRTISTRTATAPQTQTRTPTHPRTFSLTPTHPQTFSLTPTPAPTPTPTPTLTPTPTATPTPTPSSTVTFGFTYVGVDHNGTSASTATLQNYIIARVSPSGGTGTGNYIEAYLSATSADKNVQAALYYADGTLVTNGTTNTVTIPAGAAPAWYKFTFTSPPTITDSMYWIAICGQSGSGTLYAYYNTQWAASGDSISLAHTYGTWPSPLTGATAQSRIFSIYCTYTPNTTPRQLKMTLVEQSNHAADSTSDLLGSVPYDLRLFYIKPEIILANTPHGLYGEINHQTYNQAYNLDGVRLQNVEGYHNAGIKIFGYITAGYEGSHSGTGLDSSWYTLTACETLINNMALYDGVDGVFIDEVTDNPNDTQKAFLTSLGTYAHSLSLTVMMNTGTNGLDSWFFTSGVADYMMSTEEWDSQWPTPQTLTSTQQTYGSRIAVTSHADNNTQARAYAITMDAWNRGVKYCYPSVTNYYTIPPWFEGYANNLYGSS
jgi:hypothetical protein